MTDTVVAGVALPLELQPRAWSWEWQARPPFSLRSALAQPLSAHDTAAVHKQMTRALVWNYLGKGIREVRHVKQDNDVVVDFEMGRLSATIGVANVAPGHVMKQAYSVIMPYLNAEGRIRDDHKAAVRAEVKRMFPRCHDTLDFYKHRLGDAVSGAPLMDLFVMSNVSRNAAGAAATTSSDCSHLMDPALNYLASWQVMADCAHDATLRVAGCPTHVDIRPAFA